MRTVLTSLFIAVLLFFASNSDAQTKNNSVEQAVVQLREALLSGNESKLRAISSPHLSYGHSNGLKENQDAFIATLISHTLYAKTNNDGVMGEVKLKVLLIFQKEKGAWALLARQAVKIPI